MENLLFRMYYIFLMPYIERDRYFEILCDMGDKDIKREIINL